MKVVSHAEIHRKVIKDLTPENDPQLWIWYTPAGLGGVETYLLNMAREASTRGAIVGIAATRSTEGRLREQLQQTGVQLFDWGEFHQVFMGRAPLEPLLLRVMADLNVLRPRLIVLNDCNEFSIGAAPLIRRMKKFATIIDVCHIDPPGDEYLQLRQTFIDTLDGLVGTNQRVLERFARHYSTIPKTRYIPNGVPPPIGEREGYDGTLRMIYVGRIAQEQKRILALPFLLDRLRASGTSFAMTIVGDGPEAGALAERIQTLELAGHVRLLGYAPPDEVARLFRQHDVLINLSVYEGFSMSVLEAFAAGCIPFCTDLPSLDRGVFADGVTCRLCPPDDIDLMAEMLIGLTPDGIRMMSANAERVGQGLSAGRMYEQYLRFVTESRASRPIQPWPTEQTSFLSGTWDPTKNNPWIPHRGLIRRIVHWLRTALGGGG